MQPSDFAKVTNNLKRYSEFYPEHKNYRLYGVIAGFSFSADAVKASKSRACLSCSVWVRLSTLM